MGLGVDVYGIVGRGRVMFGDEETPSLVSSSVVRGRNIVGPEGTSRRSVRSHDE